MYCGKCGTQIADDSMFCEKCGAQVMPISQETFVSPQRRKSKKFYAVIAAVVLAVILVIVIPVSISNSPGSKLVGEWSTEKGADSTRYSFKSNGDVIKSDFFGGKTYDYKLSGNTLIIGSVEYEYSSVAKEDSDYWCIDGDVLYLDGRTLYRQ